MRCPGMLVPALAVMLAATPAAAQDEAPPAVHVPTAAELARFAQARRRLARWTSPAMRRFDSEAQIRRWLTDARAAEQIVPRTPSQEVLIVEPRVAPHGSPPAREPLPGLDEGDDVRAVGRFLLILHNGRVYSIDTGNAPGAAARLADRADPGGPDWTLYDSLLVHGNQVIVVGYSEHTRSILLSFLRLGPDGRLRREGIHLVTSRDEGYGVALVGDRLVIYGSTNFPYWGGSTADFPWPTLRRWDQEAGDRQEPPRRDRDGEEENAADAQVRRGAVDSRPLLRPADVYRPLVPTMNAELHIVSICPLGSGPVTRLACRSTGLAASIHSGALLAPDAAYLFAIPNGDEEAWLDPACPNGDGHVRGMLYRVPVGGGGPTALAVDGIARTGSARPDGMLRAIVDRPEADGCGDRPSAPTLLTAPAAAFAATPARAGSYAAGPDGVGEDLVFARGHLIRFSEEAYGSDRDDIDLIPLARPRAAVELEVPHSVRQVEPVPGGALLGGLDEAGRLVVTFLALDERPRLGASLALTPPTDHEDRERYAAAALGNVIGVAVDRPGGVDGEGDPIESPDIVFLSPDRDGALHELGRLERGPDGARLAHSGFCDRPCYAWSRHSRAIFMNGRIFGFAGAELIEGRIADGRIAELRRFNIVAAPVPPGR